MLECRKKENTMIQKKFDLKKKIDEYFAKKKDAIIFNHKRSWNQ